MHRYGSGRNVSTTTTTTTTEDSSDASSERHIRRLRLTLHDGKKSAKTANTAEKEKEVNGAWKKKNGLTQRERPAGRESPQQHLGDATNGVPETSLQRHGPKVYGVVQRTGSDRQQEVMAREWTVTHLQDEMKYIREVRDSLEKVRERMYGQFGGMQQSMQKLSQEIKSANASRRSLESEVKIRTQAMESFDQMNSSLISANIGLQKSLLENCQIRVDRREEVKNLQSNWDKAQQKLRDRDDELAAAHAENQTLRQQVETSQEASSRALTELSVKLEREYEEKLREEQQKHREEIEKLQAQIDEYIRRLEEAEKNIQIAEAKIAERDQRIIEVERLLDCMGKEKSHLSKKLQESEQRLRLLELTDKTDAAAVKRSKELQSETEELRERIKHLNDMVFCQQRKVKGMIEEVGTLRAQVAQKDMFISELLDRIAIVECENNELEDKLKYFMSTQSRPREASDTREIGVGCDLLPRREGQGHDGHPRYPSHPHPHPTASPPPSPKKPPSTAQPPPSPSPSHPPPLSSNQPSSPVHSSPPYIPSSPPPPLSPIQPSSPAHSFTLPQPSYPVPPLYPATQPSSAAHNPYLTERSSSTLPSPSSRNQFYLTTPTQPRTFKFNPPASRLDASLLKYTPGQYSRYLQDNPPMPSPYSRPNGSESQVSSAGRDEVDAETNTHRQASQADSNSSPSSPKSKSKEPKVYIFMKLMEKTNKVDIE